jgi:hypothetical protein
MKLLKHLLVGFLVKSSLHRKLYLHNIITHSIVIKSLHELAIPSHLAAPHDFA